MDPNFHAFLGNRPDYCNSLLYGIGDGLLKTLQTVQNSTSRVVTGITSHGTDTARPPLAPHPAANRVQACHDRLHVSSRSCSVVLGRWLLLGFCSSRSTSSALGRHQETVGTANKNSRRHQSVCSIWCCHLEQSTSRAYRRRPSRHSRGSLKRSTPAR